MNKHLYYIDCLTNLHVGAGDINYNIVDKEVEKDPITGYPTIHSSGIKGALRDAFRAAHPDDKETEVAVFGDVGDNNKGDTTGAYHFINAQFISRPMRTVGDVASIPVTTVDAINNFIMTAQGFGISLPIQPVFVAFPENVHFLASCDKVKVEGEETEKLSDDVIIALKPLLGEKFAIAESFDGYDLPVIARNNLDPDKPNLWYEEYVPHGTRFAFIVLTPDDDKALDLVIPKLVQLGGNASVGYGYCNFKKAEG